MYYCVSTRAAAVRHDTEYSERETEQSSHGAVSSLTLKLQSGNHSPLVTSLPAFMLSDSCHIVI